MIDALSQAPAPAAGDVARPTPAPDPRPTALVADHGPLRGRHEERGRLEALLRDLRAGHGQALVLHGPEGIGKTMMIDHAAAQATGCRTVRVAGVRTEAQVDYAGLHALCLPALGRLAHLPGPHADALRAALGLHEAPLPSPLRVGLGLLSLLTELAAERPLLCLVDDAQWLDPASAQAIGLAVRRLRDEPVAAVIATRDLAGDDHLASLLALRLRPLGDDDAHAVLDVTAVSPLDARVRARIVAEAHGTPRALVDALRDAPPEQTAGGLGLALAPPLAGRVAEDDVRALEQLPADARRWVLIAALEPFGDPVAVLEAARGAGLPDHAMAPAAEAGLLAVNGLVRFRSPHLRRVVHDAASPQERRDAHAALAGAADGEVAIWHRSHAAEWPQEAFAEQLERAAWQARPGCGTALAAALLQRAAELSPDAAQRARRALAAADLMHDAGAAEAAVRLLAAAEAGPLDGAARTRAQVVRGRIAHTTTNGGESVTLLLEAAQQMRLRGDAHAADGYRDAFLAAQSAGRLARRHTIVDVGLAIGRAALGASPRDRLIEGLGAVAAHGYGAGAPLLREALAAAPPADATPPDLRLGSLAARALADDAAWDHRTALTLQRAVATGAVGVIIMGLVERFSFDLTSGQLPLALEHADHLRAAIANAPSQAALDPALWLAAWTGRADEALALIETRRTDAVRRGHGQWLTATDQLGAMLLNGLGRYDEALTWAVRTTGHPGDLGLAVRSLPELVEAAVRAGQPRRARAAADRLDALAAAAGTDWALGAAAGCDALLAEGDEADALYREAIARLGRTRIRSAFARAHLLYGEWLRRERRRVDAREHLRLAHGMLVEMGAEGFAERARRELIATGETVRRRGPDTLDDLTAQEAEIARLAAAGATNREIGAQLFLSPRTVEWHLRKIFAKLGVSSRKALAGALGGAALR